MTFPPADAPNHSANSSANASVNLPLPPSGHPWSNPLTPNPISTQNLINPPEQRSVKSLWFSTLIRLSDSVIPAMWKRVTLCALVGLLVSWGYGRGLTWLGQPGIDNVVPSLVLGLLLVFRTNTAYDRFWEGRKAWGTIVNASRNLVRQILVTVQTQSEAEQLQQNQVIRLVGCFAIAMKQHLRDEPLLKFEFDGILTEPQLSVLTQVNHPALEIAVWIDDYLQQQQRAGHLNVFQLNGLMGLISQLVDALGACERIIKTPVPLAYSIHLKQLLLLYCLSLPFTLVDRLGWLTGLVAALVSFTMLGIEAIALDIENPFGRDRNDLPLEYICATIRRNLEDLITLGAACGRWDPNEPQVRLMAELRRPEDLNSLE
jgi:ion channel-forming bestrophin family protein